MHHYYSFNSHVSMVLVQGLNYNEAKSRFEVDFVFLYLEKRDWTGSDFQHRTTTRHPKA